MFRYPTIPPSFASQNPPPFTQGRHSWHTADLPLSYVGRWLAAAGNVQLFVAGVNPRPTNSIVTFCAAGECGFFGSLALAQNDIVFFDGAVRRAVDRRPYEFYRNICRKNTAFLSKSPKTGDGSLSCGIFEKEQIIHILTMLIEVIHLDNEESCVYACEHSPHPSTSKWKAFATYLICKRKYYFRFDSSAICKKCGTHIRTPKLYRSPWLLAIYCAVSIMLSVGVFLPSIGEPGKTDLSFGLYFLMYFLFDRMFIAAIFAFAKWPLDEEKGECSGKDAIWGNSRILPGLYCFLGTLLVLRTAF